MGNAEYRTRRAGGLVRKLHRKRAVDRDSPLRATGKDRVTMTEQAADRQPQPNRPDTEPPFSTQRDDLLAEQLRLDEASREEPPQPERIIDDGEVIMPEREPDRER